MAKSLSGQASIFTPPDPASAAGTDWTPYTPVWYQGPNVVGGDFSAAGEYRAEHNPDGSWTIDLRIELRGGTTGMLFDGTPFSFTLPDGFPPALSAAGSGFMTDQVVGGGLTVWIVPPGWAPTGSPVDFDSVGPIKVWSDFSGDPFNDFDPNGWDEDGISTLSIRYHTGSGVCETFTDQEEDVLNLSQPYVPGSTSVRSTATGDSADPLTVTWTEGGGPQEYDETDPSTGEITLFGSRPTPTGRVVVCYTPA